MICRILLILLVAIQLASCGASEKIVKDEIKNANHKASIENNENEVLTSTSRTVVPKDIVYNYIQEFKDIAMQNMKDYKIPASIILAQGVLESGSGKGLLSRKSNNHFGIKCHKGWAGETTTHDDDDKGECFRKYDDPAESYRDHALFLTGRERYAALFQLDITNYRMWARGLREAGYATDPKYPQKLIGLIERYNLYEYDAIALGKMKEVVPTEETEEKVEFSKPVVKEVVEQKKEEKVKEQSKKEEPTEIVQETSEQPKKEQIESKEPENNTVSTAVLKKQGTVKVEVKKEEPTRRKIQPLIQTVVNPETNELEYVMPEPNEDDISEFKQETTGTLKKLEVKKKEEEEKEIVEETVEELVIPNATASIIESKKEVIHTNDAQSGEYKEIGGHGLYKVVKGDTVYSISRKLGVSVSQIVKLNNLVNYSIAVGQILRIK